MLGVVNLNHSVRAATSRMMPKLLRIVHVHVSKNRSGLITVYGIDSRFTQQCNVVFYIYADLCSVLTATSQFSILIGQNMQLTGCHNGNEMRNVTYAETEISIEWPYCSFPILWLDQYSCMYDVYDTY